MYQVKGPRVTGGGDRYDYGGGQGRYTYDHDKSSCCEKLLCCCGALACCACLCDCLTWSKTLDFYQYFIKLSFSF